MRIVDKISGLFVPPELTRKRMWVAFVVAAVTDTLQLLLGPLGWLVLDDLLDVIAMVLISAAVGFHLLLLPTFLIEMLPLADMLPTWTGCTAAVVMMRKRTQPQPPPPLPTKMANVTPPIIGETEPQPERAPGLEPNK